MNVLARFAPGLVGWSLLMNVFIQVTGIILVAALVAELLFRRHPAARHGVWVVSLAWILASPLVATSLQHRGPRIAVLPVVSAKLSAVPKPNAPAPEPSPPLSAALAPPSTELRVGQAPRDLDLGPDAAVSILPAPRATPLPEPAPIVRSETRPRGTRPRAQGPVDPHYDAPGVRAAAGGLLVLIWAMGLAFGLLRLAIGIVQLGVMTRGLVPVNEAALLHVDQPVRDALRIDRLPPVASSSRLSGPVAIGIVHPRVVLPAGLAETLTRDELRDVLIHECAHVMRRDHLIGLAQRLAAIVFWPHPLVGFLNRRLSLAREEICDNYVLKSGTACDYARTLLALTQRRGPDCRPLTAFGLLGKRWTLTDRIAGLLDPRRSTATRMTRKMGAACLLLVPGTGVALGALRFDEASAGMPVVAFAAPTERTRTPQAAAEPDGEASRPAAYSISGIVLDEHDRPVADARVLPARWFLAPNGTRTGADGRFTLTLRELRLLDETLVARTDDGLLQGIGTFREPLDRSTPRLVRIPLKAAHEVKVHVIDTQARPVVDAAVELQTVSGIRVPGATDRAGVAIIRYPSGPRISSVVALKSGVGFDYFENYHVWPSSADEGLPVAVTLKLDGAATHRAHTVDMAGQPLAGISVWPWTLKKARRLTSVNLAGSRIACVRTGRDGAAVFDWLPASLDEPLEFQALSNDHDLERASSRPVFGDASESTLRFFRSARLTGRVFESDGRPASGLMLQASGVGWLTPSYRIYTRSGEDGSYAFSLPPEQSYMVAVHDLGRAAASPTGIVLHEGQTRAGFDLLLNAGAVIRGRVTSGPDRSPVVGERVVLVENGAVAPEAWRSPSRALEHESLHHITITDKDGQYRFRVGRGKYELVPIEGAGRSRVTFELEIGDDRVHDVHKEAPSNEREASISGMVVDPTGGRERPVSGAFVSVRQSAGGTRSFETFTDDRGRFEVPHPGPRDDFRVYVHAEEGTLAAAREFHGDERDVRLDLAPAGSVSGRVVDSHGRGIAGWPVVLLINALFDDDDRRYGNSVRGRTNASGKYEFRGLAVGSRVRAFVTNRDDLGDYFAQGNVNIVDTTPARFADIVVLPRDAAADSRTGARPEAGDVETPVSIPSGPSRTEIEAVLRAGAREPVTPELVERVAHILRVERLHPGNFLRVQRGLNRPSFVSRVQANTQRALGRTANAIELIEVATRYQSGDDDATMRATLLSSAGRERGPRITISGTVSDAGRGNTIGGVKVYTDRSFTYTDASGRFSLEVPAAGSEPNRVYAQAEGFARASHELEVSGAAGPGPRTVSLRLAHELPFAGRVVDPAGWPVAGALVQVIDPGLGEEGAFEVVTDRHGRFSIHGIPRSDRSLTVTTRHDRFRSATVLWEGSVAATSLTLSVGSACTVAGVVVDQQGAPQADVDVQLRRPGSLAASHTTLTASDGRFRFENVASGAWIAVVQPDRYAPTAMPLVAVRDNAVENQLVVMPGAFVEGRVVDQDGNPVEGAVVGRAVPMQTAESSGPGGEFDRRTVSDADGSFRLGPLPAGRFQISAELEAPSRSGKALVASGDSNVVIRVGGHPAQ